MERTSPNRMEIEARLRRLNLEIWNDVRRDLQKQQDRANAIADLLIDLNLILIDRDVEEHARTLAPSVCTSRHRFREPSLLAARERDGPGRNA